MTRIGRVLGVIVPLLLASTQAFADEKSELPAASLSELLRTGLKAKKAQQWEECIQAYTAAAKLDTSPDVMGNLGLCEEQAGRFPDAHRHLRAALDVGPTAPKTEPWKTYQAAIVRLRDRVAILIVTATPPNAAVVLDGRPQGRADGRGIAVTPGTHTIAGRLEGYEDAIDSRTIAAGDVPHVHLDLKPKPKVAVAKTKEDGSTSAAKTKKDGSAAVATPPSPGSDASRIGPALCLPEASAPGVLVPIACLSTAAFVASAGTAIGFEVHAVSMHDALAARGFAPNQCAPGEPTAESAECVEIRSRASQRDTAMNVLIGTGIAAGVSVLAAGLSIALEPTGGPRVAATVSASGGGVTVQGAW